MKLVRLTYTLDVRHRLQALKGAAPASRPVQAFVWWNGSDGAGLVRLLVVALAAIGAFYYGAGFSLGMSALGGALSAFPLYAVVTAARLALDQRNGWTARALARHEARAGIVGIRPLSDVVAALDVPAQRVAAAKLLDAAVHFHLPKRFRAGGMPQWAERFARAPDIVDAASARALLDAKTLHVESLPVEKRDASDEQHEARQVERLLETLANWGDEARPTVVLDLVDWLLDLVNEANRGDRAFRAAEAEWKSARALLGAPAPSVPARVGGAT